MGNLADELADAFSDSGNEEDYDDGEEQYLGMQDGPEDAREDGQSIEERDLAVPPSPPASRKDATPVVTNSSLPSHKRLHQRQTSRYDGSEYGSESDLEASGMSAGLVAKIDAVDSLARRGMDNYGGSADNAFARVMDELRDLGSQSSVEASASRSASCCFDGDKQTN